jgi:hypothetical protein
MQFRNVPGDRQAEPQATVLACEARVALAEPVEHVGQELRRNPDAGVAHGELDLSAGRSDVDAHPPS